MIKRINKLFPLIGLAIFIWILGRLDLPVIISLFSQVKSAHFLVAFLILVPFYLIKVYRWQFIMRVQGIKYSFKNSFLMHAVGIFWGSVTPANAGDLAKIFYLKKDGHGWGKAFFNIFLDRLADIIFLVALGYLSLFLFFTLFQETIFNLSLFFVISAIILYFLIKNHHHKTIFRKLFYRFIPENYRESWGLDFQDFINEFKKYKFIDYFKIILITSISWLLYYAIVYFLAQGLNIDRVPFWVFGAVATLSSLAGMLPISISGVGIRDAIFILIFSQYSITAEASIALSLLVLLTLFITLALVGLICSFLKPLQIKQ